MDYAEHLRGSGASGRADFESVTEVKSRPRISAAPRRSKALSGEPTVLTDKHPHRS